MKPAPPFAILWVVGKGGCGILEILPKEISQKIYGFAFHIDMPVTIKGCCGPETTVRERRACWKHGGRAESEHGRFNLLQVSKAMRVEASWVIHTQGLLVLEVRKKLKTYLGYYCWNGQRRPPAVQPEHDREAAMWTSVGQYRRVKIDVCEPISISVDPVSYTKLLVEAAYSLCQSWSHNASSSAVATETESRRTVQVCVGSLFLKAFPFNMKSKNDWDRHAAWVFIFQYDWLHGSDADLDKMVADSGNNLMRLVVVIAKYRGLSQWKFIANTQLNEGNEGGLRWLRAFQAECAKYDMVVENGSCESAGVMSGVDRR